MVYTYETMKTVKITVYNLPIFSYYCYIMPKLFSKMHRFLLLAPFVFLFSSPSLAQHHESIDSLEVVLKSATGKHRLDILSHLAEEYHVIDTDKFYTYAYEGLNLAQSLNVPHMIYVFSNELGQYYQNMGENEKALKNLLLALKYEEVDHVPEEEMSRTMNSIGILYNRLKQYDKALEFFQRSLVIKQGLEDERSYMNTYLNIATVYQAKGDKAKAIEHYQKAEGIAERYNNKIFLTTVYTKLSGIYKEMGSAEKSNLYSKKLTDIQKK
jgi:tetratricopeptide (TPR) repeat protein